MKQKSPTTWNIAPKHSQTVYANKRSRLAYEANGEGVNKLVFMPGETDAMHDRGYASTAFVATASGIADLDRPVAHLYTDHDAAGVPFLNSQLFDNYAASVQEWNEAVQKYGLKRAEEYLASASIVNTQTISTTKALNILDRVLGLQTRNYFLEMCVTKVPAPQLVFTVDTFTEGSAQGKVPELDTPDLIAHSESRATQTLYKNVGHIAESEDALFMQIHNTMSLRQDKTIRDLARILNNQLATTIESGTTVSGGDWGVLDPTAFISNRSPKQDIQPVITTIQGNGFEVDFIAGHDKPIANFLNNDHIKGRGAVNPAVLGNPGAVNWNYRYTQVPGYPPIITDQALTSTYATVGSRDAVWLGEGPTVVANYQNDVAGFRGWLIKQWRYPYLANSGAIRTLTGVAS